MPTVTITNKAGETKTISFEEAGQYGLDPSELLTQYKAEQDLGSYVSGEDPDIKRKIEEKKALANYEKNNPEAKELSEADKKKADSFNSIENFINNLEAHYQGAGGASFGEGPIARILGVGRAIEGKLGLNSEANTYERQKKGFAATLKELTGDTGVLTENDFKRLAGLVPDLGSTPEEAKNLLNDLRSQISAKFGGEKKGTTISPKNPEVSPILNMLFGGSLDLGKDIVASMGSGGVQKSLNQSTSQLYDLLTRARNEKDPQKKKQLLEIAKQGFERGSQTASNLAGTFSESAGKGAIERGIDVGGEITGALAAPGLVKGAIQLPGQLGKLFNSASAGKALRNKAIEVADKAGESIPGNKILSSLEKWKGTAIQANPGKKSQIMNIIKEAKSSFKGKNIGVKDAKRIWDEVNSGFTQSGVTKTTVESSADRAIRSILREELDKVAPGFEKGTKMIKTGLDRTKALKKFVGNPLAYGAVGAASGAGIYGLLNLLGIGQNRNQ